MPLPTKFKICIDTDQDPLATSAVQVYRWEYSDDNPKVKYVYCSLKLKSLMGILRRVGATVAQGNLEDMKNSPSNQKGSGKFYMKLSDLQAIPDLAPNTITIYSEYVNLNRNLVTGFNFTITGKVATSYYKNFYKNRFQTVTDFDSSSDNFMGRYDNNVSNAQRVVLFKNDGYYDECSTIIENLIADDTIKTPIELSVEGIYTTAGLIEVSVNPEYTTYVNPPATAALTFPLTGIINTVQTQYFNNRNFRQNFRDRTITIRRLVAGNVLLADATKKPRDQAKVMNGNSANTIAAALGLDITLDYEWLHLLAYSFGAPDDYDNPQQIDNLVLGTAAANTQMLLLESEIKAYAMSGRTVAITVTAQCALLGNEVYAKWLAESITYDFKIYDTNADTNADNDDDLFASVGKKRKGVPATSVRCIIYPFQAVKPTVAERYIVETIIGKDIDAMYNDYDDLFNLLNNNNNNNNNLFVKPSPVPVRQLSQKQAQLFGKQVLVVQEDINDGIIQTTDGSYWASEEGATFNLGSLFSSLSEYDSDFLFSNVKITVINTNGLFFLELMGDLDLTVIPELSAFIPLVGKESSATLAGSIYFANEISSLSDFNNLQPVYIELNASETYTIPLNTNNTVVLMGVALQLSFSTCCDNVQMVRGWAPGISVNGTLAFHNLNSPDPVLLDVGLSYVNGVIMGNADVQDVNNIFGIENLNLDSLIVAFEYSENASEFALLAEFTPFITTFQFGGKIGTSGLGIYCKLDSISLDDINDIFASLTGGTTLHLPDWDLTFSDVMLSICNADDFQVEDVVLSSGFMLQATVTAGDYTTVVYGHFSSLGVSLRGEVIYQSDYDGLQLAGAMLEIDLNPENSKFGLSGVVQYESLELGCTVDLLQVDGAWKEVLIAEISGPSFGLDQIFPGCAGSLLSAFRFSDAQLVASNYEGTVDVLQAGSTQPVPVDVTPGLQLKATLVGLPYISDLIHGQMPGITLAIDLDQPGGVNSFEIDLPVPMSLDLGTAVECLPFRILINITPTPSIQLIFGLRLINIPNQPPIEFDFSLDVGIAEADASATVIGPINNFMGIQGLSLGPNLGLELGIIYAIFAETGIPSELGLMAGLDIANGPDAQVALKISEDPLEEILYAEVGNIDISQLGALITQLTTGSSGSCVMPDFLVINDLRLYFAPSGGQIGTIKFAPGASLSGSLVLWGTSMEFMAAFTTQQTVIDGQTIYPGLSGSAEISQLQIGCLSLSGYQGQDASVYVNFSPTSLRIGIDCGISFLGFLCDCYLNCQYSGVSGSIEFDFLFAFDEYLTCEVRGTGSGDLSNISALDYSLSATLDSTMNAHFQELVVQKLNQGFLSAEQAFDELNQKEQDAYNALQSAMGTAQDKVDQAQAAFDSFVASCTSDLDTAEKNYAADLNQAKADLAAAKKRFNDAMQSAQDAVANAQATYDGAMRAAEKGVNDANANYQAEIDSCQKALDKAEKKWNATFNNATAALTSAQNYVNQLNDDIKALNKEKKDAHWYQVPDIDLKIAAKEVEVTVAQSILTAATTALGAIQKSGDYIAFDTAQKALDTAKTTFQALCDDANKVLEATRKGTDFVAFQTAQNALSAVQKGVEYTAWQAANDFLNALKVTGKAAIDAAKDALKTVDNSVVKVALDDAKNALSAIANGPLADAYHAAQSATAMVSYGLEKASNMADALIAAGMNAFYFDSIALSSSMQMAKNGQPFTAVVSFHLLNRPYTFTFNEAFNFTDLKGFAQTVYEQVLTELESVVD